MDLLFQESRFDLLQGTVGRLRFEKLVGALRFDPPLEKLRLAHLIPDLLIQKLVQIHLIDLEPWKLLEIPLGRPLTRMLHRLLLRMSHLALAYVGRMLFPLSIKISQRQLDLSATFL